MSEARDPTSSLVGPCTSCSTPKQKMPHLTALRSASRLQEQPLPVAAGCSNFKFMSGSPRMAHTTATQQSFPALGLVPFSPRQLLLPFSLEPLAPATSPLSCSLPFSPSK